jgi:tetratricopeptide (TPR) repeat protein
LLRATNRPGEAEPLLRRALAIDEKSYGPDHPEVATCLANLAGLLGASKRLGEAELLFRRALAIDEKSYGPDHPEVATCLNNLALLLRASKRLGEAKRLSRRALAIFEKSYGPDHPDVVTCLNNFASLLRAPTPLRKVRRNEPCLCGSGKKYKHCHGSPPKLDNARVSTYHSAAEGFGAAHRGGGLLAKMAPATRRRRVRPPRIRTTD